MNVVTPLSSNDTSVRTQISLTKTLKQLLEEKAVAKNESLSEYLRRAALVSLVLDDQNKQKLKNLAMQVVGSVDLTRHPEWSSTKSLNRWVKNLRSEWN